MPHMVAVAMLLDVSIKALDIGLDSEPFEEDRARFADLRARVVSLTNTGPAEFEWQTMMLLEKDLAYLSAFFDASPQWSDDMATICTELSNLFGSFACIAFFPDVAEIFPSDFIEVDRARDLAIRFFTAYYTAFAKCGMSAD